MKREQLLSYLKDSPIRKNYEFEDKQLTVCIEFVKKAHEGVTDLRGFPYYTHPYRVCEKVKTIFGEAPLHSEKQINFACIIALLHDVLEDTKYTIDDIASELHLTDVQKSELAYGLSFVTHDKKNDSYADYIKKIAECPILYPIWVKYCDLLDNSSLDRVILSNDMPILTGPDLSRMNKYLISLHILRKRLENQDTTFVADESLLKLMTAFRTEAEAKRMAKKEAQKLNV